MQCPVVHADNMKYDKGYEAINMTGIVLCTMLGEELMVPDLPACIIVPIPTSTTHRVTLQNTTQIESTFMMFKLGY